MIKKDTIVAIATPAGCGGIGIVRVSGPLTKEVAKIIIGYVPITRYATHSSFLGVDHELIDQGIAIFYEAPSSFTGEDVLELHGHGNFVILDKLVSEILSIGCRAAKPGEFSHRAFLNGKIDLIQAEAISDLIQCNTEHAAKLARNNLKGEFSKEINGLIGSIKKLRIYLEAMLDFSDEDLEFSDDNQISLELSSIIKTVKDIKKYSHNGQILNEGSTVVIAGRPNVGKSTLFNVLVGQDAAIVTSVPGTTRDTIKEQIQINGIVLNIIDTAGIRRSKDIVELEGISRTRNELENADMILWVYEDNFAKDKSIIEKLNIPKNIPITIVRNKIDLKGCRYENIINSSEYEIAISASKREGIEQLFEYINESLKQKKVDEGKYFARRRHLDALRRTEIHLLNASKLIKRTNKKELLAEELKFAAACLSEITGEYSTEDLLTEIFSNFCIGK